MSRRSIVHVMDYGGRTGGSFIPAIRSLATQVQHRGDRFTVVATRVPGAVWPLQLRHCNVDVELIDNERQLYRSLRRAAPDIIHSHFTRYDVPAATFGVTTFWHVHSYRQRLSLFSEAKARIKYHMFGSNVRAWICVSRAVRDEIVARGVPDRRARVVHNGIDIDRFRPPTPSERAEARERLAIAPNDRVVLFFDRTPEKGGAVLRDALRALPTLRLLVTGGESGDWERFAQTYHVTTSPRVDDTRELYWAADVFVLPSQGEGFSYVLAEAAACGLPIAASNIAAVREILADARDLWVAPPGDAPALTFALSRALSSNPLLEGRSRVVSGFSVDRWTSDLLALYDQ